jgi:hypothetical protein
MKRPITGDLGTHPKTAQALGLTLPPTLLFQADEVLRRGDQAAGPAPGPALCHHA